MPDDQVLAKDAVLAQTTLNIVHEAQKGKISPETKDASARFSRHHLAKTAPPRVLYSHHEDGGGRRE